MHRIKDVLRLKYAAGLSHEKIARACGVSKGVVAKYVAVAQGAGLSWPLPDGLDDATLERRLFPPAVDRSIGKLGLRVLRTPYRSPRANAVCERLIGALRRECLDWQIPLGESHLRAIMKEWAGHYNRGQPHMSLGPGVPDPPEGLPVPVRNNSHLRRERLEAFARSVLGGLHHEYSLTPSAA